MADGSDIEWLKRPGTKPASWTPIRARAKATGKLGWHCEHRGPECADCYAEAINHRFGTDVPFKPGHLENGDVEVFLDEVMLARPLHWRESRTIFDCSMTDLYGRWVKPEWLYGIKAVQALTAERHVHIELTKRSERMRDFSQYMAKLTAASRGALYGRALKDIKLPRGIQLSDICLDWPLPNVWCGVSVGVFRSRFQLDNLKQTAAAVHHASFEPLLEDLGDLTPYLYGENPLQWAIFGGLSGPNWRGNQLDIEALGDAIAQCHTAGASVFVKQDSALKPGQRGRIPDGLWRREWPR